MNVWAFLALFVATLGCAFRYGGAPERWTAGMFVAALLASRMVYSAASTRYVGVEYAVAFVDMALLGGLVVILLTADRFWPIAMFAAHGLTVLSHGIKMADISILRSAYAISLAAPAYFTLLILLVAVARHQHRMRRFGADRDWSASDL